MIVDGPFPMLSQATNWSECIILMTRRNPGALRETDVNREAEMGPLPRHWLEPLAPWS